jgi:hypothetical protein
MATPNEDRVLSMVRAGTITEAEGLRLIDSLEGRRASWRMLFNPFDRVSTKTLSILAVLVTIAGVFVSRQGVRFDGSLDLHQASDLPTWSDTLLDGVSAILVTAIVLWLTSLLVARQGRIIDFLSSVAVARLPNVFIGALLPWILPPPKEILDQATAGIVNPSIVLVSIGILLPGFVWFIALLCNAFRTSSGLKGLRLGIAFTVALIASEIISKAFFFLIGTGT